MICCSAGGQPQPRLDLGGSRRVEQYVIDSPVRGDGREAALRDDEDQRTAGSGGPQQLTEGADLGQVAPSVDEDDVGTGGVDESGAFGGRHPHAVEQEAESGKHLRRRLEGIRQEQQ